MRPGRAPRRSWFGSFWDADSECVGIGKWSADSEKQSRGNSHEGGSRNFFLAWGQTLLTLRGHLETSAGCPVTCPEKA